MPHDLVPHEAMRCSAHGRSRVTDRVEPGGDAARVDCGYEGRDERGAEEGQGGRARLHQVVAIVEVKDPDGRTRPFVVAAANEQVGDRSAPAPARTAASERAGARKGLLAQRLRCLLPSYGSW